MKVFGRATDEEAEWTAPFPAARYGLKARLMGGDLLSPSIMTGTLRPGRAAEGKNFFTVIPRIVVRAWYGIACKPFLSLRAGRFGFYIGHKVFGVDSEAYRDYPLVLAEDVYKGSRALSGFTFRASGKIGL